MSTSTTTSKSSTKENAQMELTATDIRDITAAAAEALENADLAEAIADLPDDAMTDALKTFKTEHSDELATGREAAKNYKPGGSYS